MSMRRWGRAIRPGDTEAQRWPCSCGVADREGGLGAWRVLQVPGMRGFGRTRGAGAVWVGARRVGGQVAVSPAYGGGGAVGKVQGQRGGR